MYTVVSGGGGIIVVDLSVAVNGYRAAASDSSRSARGMEPPGGGVWGVDQIFSVFSADFVVLRLPAVDLLRIFYASAGGPPGFRSFF